MFRTMIRFSFVLVLGTLFCIAAWAQGTYTAASCNESDVNAVINGPTHTAVNGDTIIIPATGSPCTWTSGITINGVGIDITGTGTPNTGGGTVGAGKSNTTLIASFSGPYFNFTGLTVGETAKVELLTLQDVSGAGANSFSSMVTLNGTCTSSGCPQFRVDNLTLPPNSWEGTITQAIVTMDDLFGVIDHNTWLPTSNQASPVAMVNYSAWQGVDQNGNNSWAQPDTFGTNQEVYLENNYIQRAQLTQNDVTSGTTRGGARMVCRFNNVLDINEGLCEAHGTDWNGVMRGERQVEAYYNTVTCDWNVNSCNNIDGLVSGTGYFFSNNIDTYNGGLNSFESLDDYRIGGSYSPWGECDGTSVYDQSPFTSTSQCLDQPGTGAGLMLTGNTTPVLQSTGVAGWPQNALDPVYEAGETCTWVNSENKCSAPGVSAPSGDSRIAANDYYYAEVSQLAQTSPTSPFNGTTGTGYGTLVNRPTTCTPDVGYWATDQGTWNTYNHNQEGELYICTATNTWTLAYTPYTYPHPLESSDPPVPSPPIDLTASAH